MRGQVSDCIQNGVGGFAKLACVAVAQRIEMTVERPPALGLAASRTRRLQRSNHQSGSHHRGERRLGNPALLQRCELSRKLPLELLQAFACDLETDLRSKVSL